MAEPWTDENPGSVELGCMSNSTSELSAASSKYWNASTQLGTVQATLADWTGAAADAWRGTEASLVTSLLDSRDRILDGSAAISAYRNATQSIHYRASTARSAIASAVAVQERPRPNQDPQSIEYVEWDNDREWASRREQEAQAELYRLALERSAADDSAIRGLATALPDNWPATAAALASVGISGVGDLTRMNNIDAILDLSRRIISADAGSGDYEALTLLLGMYQYNESVMSKLFADLGGEGTVQLIDALGDQYLGNPAALEIAQQIRTGLSVLSATWTPDEAQDFVDQMFSTTAFGPESDIFGVDQWGAIGYLFGDPDNSPMGEEFSLSAAEAVDSIEREGDHILLVSAANYLTGGSALLLAENPGMEAAMGMYVQDVAGAVFQNLANHPDAALEFLVDSSPDRMTYWFDNRDWSGADGFEGPAALWYGAIQADNPPAGVDLATAVAQVNSEAMWGLAGNGSFLSDNIDDDAAWDLGAAIGLNLDSIAALLGGDYVFTDAEGERGQPGAGVLQYLLFGSEGETRPGPALTVDVIAKLLGEVGVSRSGAESIALSVEIHEQGYFATAAGNPEAIEQAMERINILTGLVDGSAVGATLADAERDDAVSDANVDLYMGLIDRAVGLIPIPTYTLSQLVSIGTGLGSDWLANTWKESLHVYDEVAQRMETMEEFQEFQAQIANGERLYVALELGTSTDIPEPPNIDDYALNPDGYIADSESWYEQVRAVPEVQAYGEATFALGLYNLGVDAAHGILA